MDYTELKTAVLNLLKDEWLSQKNSLVKLKLSKDDIEFFFVESKKMMINFLHNFLKDNGFEKPAPLIEKTFFSRQNMVMGRIDVIYNNRAPPLLIDFKTCRSKELTDDYKRQLGIYALLYKEKYHILPELGIHFLNFQQGFEKYKLSSEYIDEIKGIIATIHDKTRSVNVEDYPCTCGWCNHNFELKPDKEHGQNR